MRVIPTKLIAAQDRNLHNLPEYAYGIIKFFVLCELIDGEFKKNIETLKSEFYTLDSLPDLAEEKNSKAQIEMCMAAVKQPEWQTLFD